MRDGKVISSARPTLLMRDVPTISEAGAAFERRVKGFFSGTLAREGAYSNATVELNR